MTEPSDRIRAMRLLALITAGLAIGCGGDNDERRGPASASARDHSYKEAKQVCRDHDAVYRGCRAGFKRRDPDDVRCAELKTRAAAHRLSGELVDRVVAPKGESERETAGIIGASLYATCQQPRIPGVKDIDDYRPVKPVLEAVQRHMTQDEIAGG